MPDRARSTAVSGPSTRSPIRLLEVLTGFFDAFVWSLDFGRRR